MSPAAVDASPEELGQRLEDRPAASAVVLPHVTVQSLQASVTEVAEVAHNLRIGGLGLIRVVESDVDGEEVLLRGADVAAGTPEIFMRF